MDSKNKVFIRGINSIIRFFCKAIKKHVRVNVFKNFK